MRGYAVVALDRPKTRENIGSVLRACHCFRSAGVVVYGARYHPACTDTTAAWRHMPLVHVEDLRAAIPYDCVPVAVEITEGAVSLEGYAHPERAFYVFGPEDGSVRAEVLAWCRDVVRIPTAHCLNLAAAVNVVLYDRVAKQRMMTP